MGKENANQTNVTQNVKVKYEGTCDVTKDSLTKIQKSIGGVKGALIQTNQRVKALEEENRKMKDVIAELQESVGVLVGKIECIAYKVNQPWYKRLFK